MDGYGASYYGDGGVYKGHFANSIRGGQGTYKYTNGNIYSGLWENDKPHGVGYITYPNCQPSKVLS